MQIGVITNPNSRKNRGRRNRASELQSIIGRYGVVRETRSTEQIKPVLRDFLRSNKDFWIADGGDGALHWMLRCGLDVLREKEFGGRSELPLAMPTNGGTIDFVAKNVGIKGNADQLLAELRTRFSRGEPIRTVEVDAMKIDGVRAGQDGRDEPFSTIGFAVAVAGIGQRFFAKYYESNDPAPREIVKVVARAVGTYPVAKTPLRRLLPPHLRDYAGEVFRPASVRVVVDGREFPSTQLSGIHVASMSINLGNVLRFFGKADEPGQLHASYGTPSPSVLIRNLPRMHLGKPLRGAGVEDGPCRKMTVEAVGDELLAPVIDGEYYPGLRRISFRVGPRLRIPQIAARRAGIHLPRPRAAA